MYDYVTEKEVKEYRELCGVIFTRLRELLLKKADINIQFSLVGSGGKHM